MDVRFITNKNRIRRIAIIQIIAVIAVCFFSCIDVYASSGKNETKIVRVGYYENGIFQSGSGTGKHKSGYAYDYLQMVSVYAGWTFDYVYGDFNELYGQLVEGDIDILAGLAYLDEREGLISYPKQAMGETQYIFQKKAGNMDVTSDALTFEGKKIGTVDSAMKTVVYNYLRDNNINSEVVLYSDLTKCNLALVNGDVDISLVEGSGAEVDNRVEAIAMAGSTDYYIGVNIQRPDLLDDLNDAQNRIYSANPGFQTVLNQKWSKNSVLYSTLSQTEREWVKEHTTFHVGYYGNNLPYCGKDKYGNVSGIIKDVVPELFYSLNITDINIEYIEYETYGKLKSALRSGDIDIAFPAYVDYWVAENNDFAVSDEVVTSYFNILYKDTYPNMNSAVIAMTKDDKVAFSFKSVIFPKNEIQYFDDMEQCFNAVASGKVDFCLINSFKTDSVFRSFDEYRMLKVAQVPEQCPLGFVLERNSTSTLEIINHAIAQTDANFAISQAYKYEENYEPAFMDYISRNIRVVYAIVFAIALIVIGLISRDLIKKKKNIRYEETRNKELQEKVEEISELNEQLRAKQKILEESKKYSSLRIQTMSDAIHGGFKRGRKDKDFSIISVSEQFAQMLGYDSSEEFMDLTEGNMLAIVNEEDAKHEIPKGRESVLKGEIYTMDFRIRCKDGSWKNVEERGRLIHNPEGEEEFWSFLVDRDELMQKSEALEEAKKLNRELEKVKRQLEIARDEAEAANQAKTAFLFNMSHDIRTPMNAIIGFRDLLEKNQDNPEKRSDYLYKIDDASRVLLSIINNVLEMARIEKGTLEVNETAKNAISFNSSLRAVFDEMMRQKGIEFKISVNIQHENVYCDTTKLREVFINLLSNAYKYTPKGGTVTMSLEEIPSDRNCMARFKTTISDTGIGMSEDFLPHIFEEFSREQNTTDTRIEGTGLGMSIVKRLVDILGGTIAVESTKDVGTTFTVIFDHRIADENIQMETFDAIVDPEMIKGKRILLAEDNELNAEIAKELLEEHGLIVEHAADGLECVNMIKSSQTGYYDLILMDIQMPGMNGYEATRAIRNIEDAQKAEIKILAITANAFEEDKQEALKAGMNGHVSKPIDISILLDEIASVLKD